MEKRSVFGRRGFVFSRLGYFSAGLILFVALGVLFSFSYTGFSVAGRFEDSDFEVQAACVNLSDSSTFGTMVTNSSGTFIINLATTLCTGVYNSTVDMIKMGANLATLDCNYSVLGGTSGVIGINTIGKSYVTVKNCQVSGFKYGIFVNSTSLSTFTNNTANNNAQYGFFINASTVSSNNIYTFNIANNNGLDGFYFLSVLGGADNLFNNNTAISNGQYGFGIYSAAGSFNRHNITNNTANFNTKSGFYFVSLLGRFENNTIDRNNALNNTQYGFSFYRVYNSNVTNNIVNNNSLSGILPWTSWNNRFLNNSASGNVDIGFYLYYTNNTEFVNNTVNNNSLGFGLVFPNHNNIIDNNTIQDNWMRDVDIFSTAVYPEGSCNNVFVNNLGSGARWINYTNVSVEWRNFTSSEAILCGAHYSNVSNLTITGSDWRGNNGFVMAYTKYANVTGVNSSDNYYGFYISNSTNNIFLNNIGRNNTKNAFFLRRYSHDNLFDNNTMMENKVNGMTVLDSRYLNISNSTVINNTISGLFFYNSSANIFNNTIKNNNGTSLIGTTFYSLTSYFSLDTIFENSTFSGGGGILTLYNSSLSILNNTFCNNTPYNIYLGDTNISEGAKLINNTNSFCLSDSSSKRITLRHLFQVRMVNRGLNLSGANVTLFKANDLTNPAHNYSTDWQGLTGIMFPEYYGINETGGVSFDSDNTLYQISLNVSGTYTTSTVYRVNRSQMYPFYGNEYWFNATGPSVSASCPSSANDGDSVAASCSGSDEFGVTSVSMTLDGNSFCSGGTSCSGTYRAVEGSHRFICYATDAEGNSASAACNLMVYSNARAAQSAASAASAAAGGEEVAVTKGKSGGVRVTSEDTMFDIYFKDNKPVLDISFLKPKLLGVYKVVDYVSPKGYVSAFLLGGIILCCALLFGNSIISGLGVLNKAKTEHKPRNIGKKRGEFLGGRKGQFFLVASLVFMLVIFSLVVQYNTIHEVGGIEHFDDLASNFNKEAPKVVNSALSQDEVPEEKLESFATNFQGYAAQQDPNFGVAYVYVNPETHIITISNILADKKIKIVPTSNGIPVPISGDLIFSKDTATTGSICLSGLGNAGCSTASSKISTWGAGLSKTEINLNSVDVDKIDLRIEDQPSIWIPGTGSIKDSQLGWITSAMNVKTKEGNVNVDVSVCDDSTPC